MKTNINTLKDALALLESITYCSYIRDDLKELIGISKSRSMVELDVSVTIDNDNDLVFNFYNDEYDDNYYISIDRVVDYLISNYNLSGTQ